MRSPPHHSLAARRLPALLSAVLLALALQAQGASDERKPTGKAVDKPVSLQTMQDNANANAASTARPLFFSELVAFSTEEHRALTLPAQRHDFRFAAAAHLLPLTLAEAPLVVRHYPMVFVQEGESVGLAALVGLPGGGNRFVDAQGAWRAGTYIPAYVRGYPFIAVRPAPDAQPVIAFDPNAADFKAKNGQALIGADGQPSEAMKFIVAFQTEYMGLRERTQRATQALKEAGVLEGGHLNIGQPNGETAQFDGFLVVNETKLRELKPEALKRLSDADALGLAYAQLMSLGNLDQLQPVVPGAATASTAGEATHRSGKKAVPSTLQ